MNSIAIIVAFLFIAIALQASIVWLAARCCRLERRGWWRAMWIVVLRLVMSFALVVFLSFLDDEACGYILRLVLEFVIDALLTIYLFKRLFGGTTGKAIGAWAIQFVFSAVAGIGLITAIHTLVHAYTASSSSMSPNLRGYHVIEVLSNGNHLIVAANDPRDVHPLQPGTMSGGIVAETFEYKETPRPAVHTNTADRFICNKTKFPERWEIAVYKSPEDQSTLYVKRLVGLPGEQIEIRNGAVSVNGERLSPPERLGPIRYSLENARFDENGEGFAITLGADEYFVLGDNANKSADSRILGPLKRDAIVGVADLIYWPPSRWRLNP
jgi:signal peptidase I